MQTSDSEQQFDSARAVEGDRHARRRHRALRVTLGQTPCSTSHAWVVPGWESPLGVFSHDNPDVLCADGTTKANAVGFCQGT
jgi:hypothetical protein